MIRAMGAYRSGHLVAGTREEALLGSPGPYQATQSIHRCSAAVEAASTDFVWIALVDPTKAECKLIEETFGVEARLLDDAVSPPAAGKGRGRGRSPVRPAQGAGVEG